VPVWIVRVLVSELSAVGVEWGGCVTEAGMETWDDVSMMNSEGDSGNTSTARSEAAISQDTDSECPGGVTGFPRRAMSRSLAGIS
jgi:hypothetical protein